MTKKYHYKSSEGHITRTLVHVLRLIFLPLSVFLVLKNICIAVLNVHSINKLVECLPLLIVTKFHHWISWQNLPELQRDPGFCLSDKGKLQ
jgi:hypothetical protein